MSKLAKVASLALAFGLVAGSPAYAVDLQGSGASFPALLIEGCKAGFAASNGGANSFVYASSSSGTGQANSDKKLVIFGCQMVLTQQPQSVLRLSMCH